MTAQNARKRPSPELNGSGDGTPRIVSLRSVPEDERTGTKVDAFEINGVMYQISTQPKVNTALRYLHISRTQGAEAGIDYMLGVLLGDEGYEALMGFDDLTQESLEQVITIASKIMAGAVEDPKGKRKNG